MIIEGDKAELERFKHRKEVEENISKVVQYVQEDSVVYERIVNNLVSQYCEDLDKFVDDLNKLIIDIKAGRIKYYSELKLEMKCIELSAAMYKASEGLSALGSQSDVAKANREQIFSKAYQRTGAGTIADKTAEANSMIAEEILVEKLMDRAFKVLSNKIKNANRVLEAIKKVLTSRMVNKEVFRKEAPVYDLIDGSDILDDSKEDNDPEEF